MNSSRSAKPRSKRPFRKSALSWMERIATPPPSNVQEEIGDRRLRHQGNFHLHRLPFTFAPLRKPPANALRKSRGRYAKTRFYLPFADRQGVIKLRGVGERAHANLIQPLQRTSFPLAADQQLHFEFLCVHSLIISSRLCAPIAELPSSYAGDIQSPLQAYNCNPTANSPLSAGTQYTTRARARKLPGIDRNFKR